MRAKKELYIYIILFSVVANWDDWTGWEAVDIGLRGWMGEVVAGGEWVGGRADVGGRCICYGADVGGLIKEGSEPIFHRRTKRTTARAPSVYSSVARSVTLGALSNITTSNLSLTCTQLLLAPLPPLAPTHKSH